MFYIKYCAKGYYLNYNQDNKGPGVSNDYDLADILNINREKYFNFAKQCNGNIDLIDGEYELYFKKEKDINSFIELLTPYIIPLKLLGGKINVSYRSL
ncbi:MAG: hypothetical protein ACOCP8_01905 [archaeon]